MMAKQQKANQSPESTDENIVRKLTQLCEPKEEKEEEKQKEKRKIFFFKLNLLFLLFLQQNLQVWEGSTQNCAVEMKENQYRQINKPLQTNWGSTEEQISSSCLTYV